ncbi:MAG: rod shape-determining protein RodA [Rhodomicrobium sp.]|nr:MAG: rod shape-determining protein RodA [Rhodomicrobium sp.]
MNKIIALTITLLLSFTSFAFAEGSKAPEGAKAYFVNLKDGDTVKSPVTIIFGLKGMGVAPAGVKKDNTGHHHLLLDRPPLGSGEEGKDELTSNLPADENHIHFGKGQTEKTLELKPGKHTLQLVLGDHSHTPHNPPVTSDVITITVE